MSARLTASFRVHDGPNDGDPVKQEGKLSWAWIVHPLEGDETARAVVGGYKFTIREGVERARSWTQSRGVLKAKSLPVPRSILFRHRVSISHFEKLAPLHA